MMLGKWWMRALIHWGAAGKPWLLFKDWRNSLELGIVSDFAKIHLEVAGMPVLAGREGGGHGSQCLGVLWAHPRELLGFKHWNCTGISPTAHGLRVGKIC